eukprot:sb/3467094/
MNRLLMDLVTIGVFSNLSRELKDALHSRGERVLVTIETFGIEEVVGVQKPPRKRRTSRHYARLRERNIAVSSECYRTLPNTLQTLLLEMIGQIQRCVRCDERSLLIDRISGMVRVISECKVAYSDDEEGEDGSESEEEGDHYHGIHVLEEEEGEYEVEEEEEECDEEEDEDEVEGFNSGKLWQTRELLQPLATNPHEEEEDCENEEDGFETVTPTMCIPGPEIFSDMQPPLITGDPLAPENIEEALKHAEMAGYVLEHTDLAPQPSYMKLRTPTPSSSPPNTSNNWPPNPGPTLVRKEFGCTSRAPGSYS